MDEITLVQPESALYGSYNACVSVVAQERRYIGIVHTPTIEETSEYVDAIASVGGHIALAVDHGQVIGWCSTTPQTEEGFTHVTHIGMGLLPDYRGRGIGRRLLNDALDWSWDSGYERVELSVFTDNEAAIHLYRNAGFVEEGIRHRARKLDGLYNDIMQMGIFRPETG